MGLFSALSSLAPLPTPFTAVGMGVVLNLFFKRHPALQVRMSELADKIFEFHVEDLNHTLFMRVDGDGGVRMHTYSDDPAHVTMAGTSGAFLSLLFGNRDPDSLFFSRQLKLSGETDTGLRFKNILDNVDIDYRRELSALVGAPVANGLAWTWEQWRNKTRAAGEQAEQWAESWLDQQQTPRREDSDSLYAAAQALESRMERLERAVHRVSLRLALRRGRGAV
ncbi:MAG: SCP2 sterol-binding domain-containing protein [Magnetococcus sp. WYHC-3]